MQSTEGDYQNKVIYNDLVIDYDKGDQPSNFLYVINAPCFLISMYDNL